MCIVRCFFKPRAKTRAKDRREMGTLLEADVDLFCADFVLEHLENVRSANSFLLSVSETQVIHSDSWNRDFYFWLTDFEFALDMVCNRFMSHYDELYLTCFTITRGLKNIELFFFDASVKCPFGLWFNFFRFQLGLRSVLLAPKTTATPSSSRKNPVKPGSLF